jgi:argininosuccinate lyase
LVINPARALEELNSDWTASQELADVLMRTYKLPFRVGHHFASEVVDYAKANDIRPTDFPYAEAQRIYKATLQGDERDGFGAAAERSGVSRHARPVAIIRNRATSGGPAACRDGAHAGLTAKQKLAQQEQWTKERRGRIDTALAALDRDFGKILERAK